MRDKLVLAVPTPSVKGLNWPVRTRAAVTSSIEAVVLLVKAPKMLG